MDKSFNSKHKFEIETVSKEVPFPVASASSDELFKMNLKVSAHDPHVDIKKEVFLMLIESGDMKDIVHTCDICNTEIKDGYMYKCPKCIFFDVCIACHYDLYNDQKDSKVMSPCGHSWNEYKQVENSFEQFTNNLKENKDVIINEKVYKEDINKITEEGTMIQFGKSSDDTSPNGDEASDDESSISENDVLEIDI